MTRMKLVLLWLLVLAMGVAVAARQWQDSHVVETYGNASMQRGSGEQFALSLLLTAIPAAGAATFAYLALEWLLFRKGELADFRARRRVAATRRKLEREAPRLRPLTDDAAKKAKDGPEPSDQVYEGE